MSGRLQAEYDAAQALLDLRYNTLGRVEKRNQENRETAEAPVDLQTSESQQNNDTEAVTVQVVIAHIDDDNDHSMTNDDSDPAELETDAVQYKEIDDDLVPIGQGNARIPASVLRHINWKSHTTATRKLLSAVFSRRVLATHSLTGKRSPAFPNKAAKKMLDPALVKDIVQKVVEECAVAENIVRTCITTKLADECKMLRMRQKKQKNSKNPRGSDTDQILI